MGAGNGQCPRAVAHGCVAGVCLFCRAPPAGRNCHSKRLASARACTRPAPFAAEVERYVAAGEQAVDEAVLAVPLAHQLQGVGKGNGDEGVRAKCGL